MSERRRHGMSPTLILTAATEGFVGTPFTLYVDTCQGFLLFFLCPE